MDVLSMDEKLLLLINREWTSPGLDRVMAAASSLDLWMPFLVAAGLALLIWGGFRGRVFLVGLGLVLALADGLVSKTLKGIVDRPRPHQALTGVRMVELERARPRLLALFREPRVKASRASEGDVEGRSFPSSHTMNLFAAATVGALCFRFGSLLFLPAALVGYSRVYTGSHWPSDVVVSAVLAVGLALWLGALLELLWRRRGGQWLPRVHGAHPVLFGGGRP